MKKKTNCPRQNSLTFGLRQAILIGVIITILLFIVYAGNFTGRTKIEWYEPVTNDGCNFIATNNCSQQFRIGNSTAPVNNTIYGVTLKIRSTLACQSNYVRFSIRATNSTFAPTGNDLTNFTINSTSLPLVVDYYNVTFNNPINATNQTTYAIVVSTNCTVGGSSFWYTVDDNTNGTMYIQRAGGDWGYPAPRQYGWFQVWGNATVSGGASTAPSVTLVYPETGDLITGDLVRFNISADTSLIANLTNATLWIWNSGAVFNNSLTNIITGHANSTNFSVAGFTLGSYEYNSWVCNNNSQCSFAITNKSFNWRPFEIVSQNYNNYIYETSYQTFNLSIITVADVLTVSSKLNYNGSLYNATTSCSAGTCNIYSKIDIPLAQQETINKSAFWQIVVYDGTNSFSFNTTDQTIYQNVSRIHLERCNATYTTPTVNFTAYREDNLSRVNPYYIAGTFNTWLGSGTVQRNKSFENASATELSLCLTPTALTHYTDTQVEYSFDDSNYTYIPRNYYFQNASLTSTLKNIPLYLLEAEDSTTFIIKVQDQSLSEVSDALVYIQRYYPSDGLFRTVQIAKTDSNGETIGFYQVETVDYKHIITKYGEILLETAQQKVVGKEVPYTLTFTVGGAFGFPWSSWETNPNIHTSLEFNKTTNIVTFSYIDDTGIVSFGRLVVTKESQSNYTIATICDTNSTQSSATLTCNMTGYDGSFIASGYIETEVVDLLNFIITTARDIFEREGLFIGLFIIMIAGFAFIWNPTAGIISINAAIILTNIMGFISVSPIFIFGLIAVSIVAIILLKT